MADLAFVAATGLGWPRAARGWKTLVRDPFQFTLTTGGSLAKLPPTYTSARTRRRAGKAEQTALKTRKSAMNTKRFVWGLVAFALPWPILGCGGGSPPAASAPATTAAAQNDITRTDNSLASTAQPAEVITEFLTALRTGDKEVAEKLLTKTAREETAKHDLTVQPPGSPDIAFEIGVTELVGEPAEEAHVQSTWREPNSEGTQVDFEIIWVLRKQTEGWRIAGMATQLVPDQDPIFLNFEDPGDMLAKWAEADQMATELAEPAVPAVGEADKPGVLR